MKQHQEKGYFQDKFKPHEKGILSSSPVTQKGERSGEIRGISLP